MTDSSFTWNAAKAITNLRKHGVSFAEGATAFKDPLCRIIPAPDHSIAESRFVLMGISERGRILVVVHVEREDSIRVISARKATRWERMAYEEDA